MRKKPCLKRCVLASNVIRRSRGVLFNPLFHKGDLLLNIMGIFDLYDGDILFHKKLSLLQFPVKWNAFSDRNGMLFSGLTEWLSDTNGMAR